MVDGVKYPYVMGTDKFVGFLQKIPDIGIPEKFQLKNLKSLGYSSSNDERFLPALRFIRFLDSSGSPTSLWREGRGKLGPALAKGLRAGYDQLFSQYNNAHQKDDEALRTFFSVHSGTGKDAVAKMVTTFKAMCSIAEFDEDGIIVPDKSDDKTNAASTSDYQLKSPERELNNSGGSVPVSINIQLQLPPDPTGEMYDKFFAAMAKHLPVNR